MRLSLLLLACGALSAQTVYLRDSAPAAVPVCGATNATPIVIFTCADHGLTVGDFVGVNGVATGTGVSPANGVRTVITSGSNDHNHFAIGDLSGTPIVGTGAWFDGSDPPNFPGGAQWIGKLHPYTLGAQPLGWLDGAAGPRTRQVALWTGNGLTSLVVASNVATVTTSFDYGMSSGDKLGIWSSGISALDNSHNPYTVTRVDSTHYTFTTSGVSNGSYAASNAACGPAGTPNDTIGGTLPCLRLSQRAWIGNPIWDGLETALIVTNMVTGTEYKNIFHGGKNVSGFNAPGWYANVAVKFLVDPTNTQMFAAGMYNFNNLEFLAGVNWVGNEKTVNGGNNDTNDFLSFYANGLAMVYSVFSPYASAAHKTTFLNKVYNDSDDPSVGACSSANGDVGAGHNDILATGAARNGTSNTIQLALSDSAVTGFYVNNVIMNANNQAGLVTIYDSTTKTATISGSWTAPIAGDAYAIYATITVASNAPSNSSGITTTTVTGYNTRFLSHTSLGDAIEGENFWELNPDASSSYVSATVTSDTSLTVINSWNPVTSTTVPSIVWYFPKWQPGDCGMIHRNKYWLGSPGAQPAAYKLGGGGLTTVNGGGPTNVRTLAVEGGNNTATWSAGHTVMDIVMAADDPRAIRDLQTAQSFGFDYELRHYMNYGCPAHSGTSYNYANTLRGVHQFAETLAMLPGYPDMDLAGPWITQCSTSAMFLAYPDNWYLGHTGTTGELRYGTETENGGSAYDPRILPMIGVSQDPILTSAPTSNNAKWYRNFLERIDSVSLWGVNGVNYDYDFANVLHTDPRIASSDYTVQPTQYVFKQSSNARCALLTGWPCPAAFRGDAMASRGSWTDLTASLVYAGYRTWWGDHDNPENGTLRIYKVGELATTDYTPPGGQCSTCNPDQTTMGDMLQIGGSNASVMGGGGHQPSATSGTSVAGMTPITRWASQYAGSLGAAYGDQNSKYAYVCADLSGAYSVPINHALQCVGHFKKPGADEFVAQQVSVDVTGNSTQLEAHIHYAQSGDGGTVFTYPEGQTTCPGAGSCLSLNTNRAIQSLQDGGTNGVTARTFGILSNFVSPSTITLRDDAAVNTVVISSVRKTATLAISSYVTGSGFVTTINTAADHNLISGEVVMFTAVVGTGCTGASAFNNGVFTWVVTVTGVRSFTIPFDSRSICTSPSSGNVTTITLFNATGHGLINGATVKVAGATGSWAVWNQASMTVEVVDANHFNEYWQSSPDTSAYPTAFDGTITKFYPGGFGYTHRISICGGGTCGASTTGLEYIVAHKIVNGLTDTALTTTALNPDANWTGAQMCGTRSCAVYLGARHGVTQATMAGFTTTHSGSAQYLFGGITAGSGYAITINGTPVTGSPFTVAAGDNSIEFESTAGTVSLNGGSPVCGITTSSLPGGTVGISYSQTVSASNCTAPITWTVSAGTLCGGLSLGSSTGVISGTPTTAQTCSFTVQGVDAFPTTTSQALSIVIASGSAGRAPVVGGRAGASGKIIVH